MFAVNSWLYVNEQNIMSTFGNFFFLKIEYIIFKDIMCTLFMDIYKHFIPFCLYFVGILCSFCFPFLSLLFYRDDIDILYTFQVVLRVYFTDILCTFYRHYKAIFCVHFIDIFCSSFGGNFMKISLTFYPTYFTEFFVLEYFTRIMFSI